MQGLSRRIRATLQPFQVRSQVSRVLVAQLQVLFERLRDNFFEPGRDIGIQAHGRHGRFFEDRGEDDRRGISSKREGDGGSGRLTQEKQTPKSAPWLFAGDTLFAGSIGRTDLWGGSYPDIIRSIHTKLLALPESTIVFPGHGPTTTLAAERASNPFLQSR